MFEKWLTKTLNHKQNMSVSLMLWIHDTQSEGIGDPHMISKTMGFEIVKFC